MQLSADLQSHVAEDRLPKTILVRHKEIIFLNYQGSAFSTQFVTK